MCSILLVFHILIYIDLYTAFAHTTLVNPILKMNKIFQIEVAGYLPRHSDKCIFPSSVLELVLKSHPELPHPLVLELVASERAYVGVLEFTAPEDTIMVPEDIFKTLDGENVTIGVAELPKGTFLKVKPAQFYSHVTNWKYYLESFLSTKYTVLSKNQKFYFDDKIAGENVELLVEDCNAESVVVVETNVALDMVPLNDIMAAQQLQHGINLATLENIPIFMGELELKVEPFNQVSLQHIYKIDLRKAKESFSIILETNGEMANVDLICALDKFLTLENFRWCTMSLDSDNSSSKAVSINIEGDLIRNQLAHSETECWLYLVPFAWENSSSVFLSLKLDSATKDEKAETIKGIPDAEGIEAQATEIKQKCSNCGVLVSLKNLRLHEAVCHRKNRKCSCGEVFIQEIPPLHWHCDNCVSIGNSRLLQFKHNRLFHSGPYKCQSCDNGTAYESFIDLIYNHKGSDCPSKLHECQFCHLVLPQEESNYEDRFNNLSHHESQCGNKTVECFKCHKSIRNKDFKTHMQLHYLSEEAKISEEVSLCSNVNCINVVDDLVHANEMGLCEKCYGPLYSPSEDPTNIKLQERLERKYVIQLSRGCGHSWCDNKECATGNVKLVMKLCIARVKDILLAQVNTPKLPINGSRDTPGINQFWFCIDESIYLKKVYLLELKAEKRFQESMIYKALYLKGLDGARQYLIETA